jgi:hypothetical protein
VASSTRANAPITALVSGVSTASISTAAVASLNSISVTGTASSSISNLIAQRRLGAGTVSGSAAVTVVASARNDLSATSAGASVTSATTTVLNKVIASSSGTSTAAATLSYYYSISPSVTGRSSPYLVAAKSARVGSTTITTTAAISGSASCNLGLTGNAVSCSGIASGFTIWTSAQIAPFTIQDSATTSVGSTNTRLGLKASNGQGWATSDGSQWVTNLNA